MINCIMFLLLMHTIGFAICHAQTSDTSKQEMLDSDQVKSPTTSRSIKYDSVNTVSQPAISSKAQEEASIKSDNVIAYVALSIPVGDFGSTNTYYAGFAKTGPAIGLDINLPFTPQLAWKMGINISFNKFDAGKIFEGTGISTESGSWTTVWLLSGLRFSDNITGTIRFHIFGELGMFVGYQSEIPFSTGYYKGTFDSAISNAFAFGYGGGVSMNGFMILVRSFQSEPKYLLDEGKEYPQPTACIQICAGITF